jgi:hypothetical protein
LKPLPNITTLASHFIGNTKPQANMTGLHKKVKNGTQNKKGTISSHHKSPSSSTRACTLGWEIWQKPEFCGILDFRPFFGRNLSWNFNFPIVKIIPTILI